jgi:outer membrane lipoprotein-sorting protein
MKTYRPHRAALAALACLAAVTLPATPASAAPSGREILLKQEAARKIPTFTAHATIATGKEGGEMREKGFTWWRKLSADGVHFQTLTRFTAPASIRNEGLLLRERAGGDNDVQLYLPSFKKVRRVESQSQRASFMGSVFSYSDIAQPHPDDYQATVLREEACPNDGGPSCYVVELTPATDTVKATTGYSRSVQWVRADNFVTVKGEFYDPQNTLWKRLDATEVREVDPVSHKWLAHRVRMENVPEQRVTVLRIADVKTNVDLADSTFTEQALASEE